jgi:hypothetical protein
MSLPLYGTPKVGGDALAWCGKCKMELAHVIVAMVDTQPARVICKTCKSPHNYKRQGGASAVKRSSSKSSAPKTTVRASEYWEQKMAEKKSESFVPYDVKKTFQKGSLIQHTLFGVGVVEEVRSSTKIMVIFRVGEKVLVHGMAPQGQ